MSDTEKRSYERLKTSLNVNFALFDETGSVADTGKGVAINMSKTGMLLQTKKSLKSSLNIDIVVKIDGVFVKLKCRSMYCRDAEDGTYESGIHVRLINKKDIGTYLGFIEKLEASSEKPKSLRPGMRGMTNVVKRISAEHKIINEYVSVLSEMMLSEAPRAGYTATVLELMRKDMITHFNIEENLFFKIGSQVMPDQCDDMIDCLTSEHKEFIQTIDGLIHLLQPLLLDSGTVPLSDKENICDFLESVKKHAVVELKDLFPLLEGNAEAKRRILEKVMKLTKK